MTNSEIETLRDERDAMRERYAQNLSSLRKANKKFSVAYFWGLPVNIALTIWGFATILGGSNYHLLSTGKLAITFPVTAIAIPIGIACAVLSVLSNAMKLKKYTKAMIVIYVALIPASIVALIYNELVLINLNTYSSTATKNLIIMIVYAIVELIVQSTTLGAFEEYERLKAEDGFPAFNANLGDVQYSEQKAKRDRWLDEQAEQRVIEEAITVDEAPPQYEVMPPKSEGFMDGISITDNIAESLEDNNKGSGGKWMEEV